MFISMLAQMFAFHKHQLCYTSVVGDRRYLVGLIVRPDWLKTLASRRKPKKQGVALTGRNRTGPPCSVGRPTVHTPGGRPAPTAGSVIQTAATDDSQQT